MQSFRAAALVLVSLLALPAAVLAAQPTRCSVDAAEALRRINAARVSGQRCGFQHLPPAPRLRWDGTLQSVAAGHSRDMARRNYFDHRTPEGRSVRDRVAGTGYRARMVGENIAAGSRSLGDAMQGWLDSPAHCENLMNPQFSDVAVACVGQPGSEWGTYWTMMLGRR